MTPDTGSINSLVPFTRKLGGGPEASCCSSAPSLICIVYDLDGNLTNDGRFSISWDAENRATSFTSLTSTPAASRVKIDCQYDSLWRRTEKVVSIWNQSTLSYQPSTTNRYVYDGWNLIGILDGANALLYSFVWGTDLSGSEQGAGGIGGLISMRVYGATLGGTYFYVFDGNGNVTALISATDGSIVAQYEYGPFGEMLSATGPLASANPFRFSTKFQDDESGLVYFGHRYYDSSEGRWLNKDPLTHTPEANIYCFVGNAPAGRIDPTGLTTYDMVKNNYYGAIAFAKADIVITPQTTINVTSGNLWPFAAGGNLAKIQCLLGRLGFVVPAPNNGAFTATFGDNANAWTIKYGVLPAKRATFFNDAQVAALYTTTAEFRVVTMWHEMKGHNKDDEEDGPGFDQKYEAPVNAAISRMKKAKRFPFADAICSTCVPSVGEPWGIRNEFDRAMCACGITRPPQK